MPPPPPPPQMMEDACDDESEALSGMLIAWYMSGYHTGYYQVCTLSDSLVYEWLSHWILPGMYTVR